MRVMVFVKTTGESGTAAPPTAEAFAAMDQFTEELVEAGVSLPPPGSRTPPRPSASPSMVRPHGHRRAVRRGPRPGRRLLDLGGQAHGRGRGLGEALPNPMPGPSEIEIRPFYEAADWPIPYPRGTLYAA